MDKKAFTFDKNFILIIISFFFLQINRKKKLIEHLTDSNGMDNSQLVLLSCISCISCICFYFGTIALHWSVRVHFRHRYWVPVDWKVSDYNHPPTNPLKAWCSHFENTKAFSGY